MKCFISFCDNKVDKEGDVCSECKNVVEKVEAKINEY